MIVNKPTNKKKKKTSRYTVLCIIMGLIFGAITLRLLYIQVFNYQEYKDRANVTATRFVSDKAPRGKIYDDKGNVLATNKQTYTITYTKTDDAEKQFYTTMKELLKILDDNGESIQDTLPLKIDADGKIFFQYASDNNKDAQNAEDLRFKKDRGINDTLRNKMFKDVEELSDVQNAQLDAALLKITPEDSFYALVRSYNLIELVDPEYKSKSKVKLYGNMSDKELANEIMKQGYSINDIRRFMVIKDAIKIQSVKGFRTATIAGNIKKDTSLVIMQKQFDLPGINVTLSPIRLYPYDNLASSVLGYVSSIDDTQKPTYELKGYDSSSDLVGKAGIESTFEDVLKGVKGGSTVKVNSQGRVTQNLFQLEPYPGNDVHLTIDRDIQYAAEHALADGIDNINKNVTDENGNTFHNATRGALVAVEVKTGRILSMVSYPSFNPNLFTVPGQLTNEQYKQYISPDLGAFGQEFIKRMGLNKTVDQLFPVIGGYRTDQYDLYPKPMYNYATMSLIPPGSTFKPLTAVAGLESGVLNPGTVIVDRGKFTEHPDIYGKGFDPGGIEAASGPTTLTRAIAESINYYFYETATQMYIQGGKTVGALDSIAKYAWQFGLGYDPNSKTKGATGIEIGERFGQTYNFTSWRQSNLASARINVIDFLSKGDFNGTKFIPLDIRDSDSDSDEVKKSKQSIKNNVVQTIDKQVDDRLAVNHDEFAKSIKKELLNVMNNSEQYKAAVADYEATGRKANLDAQASVMAEAVAQYAVHNAPGEIRSPAQIVYASIGQGMNNFSPVQLVSYISTLANGGTRYKLHLVDKITDNNGNVVQEFKPEVLNTVQMSKSTQEAVKQGMTAVNNEEGGTASTTFAGFPIKTAGKTGTADSITDQREKGRAPYATYVSYAPADDPEIAVVAVVFDGGHGSQIAPAVKAVYDAYFKDRLLKEHPEYTSASDTFKKYVLGNPYLNNGSSSQANAGAAVAANGKTNANAAKPVSNTAAAH